MGRVSPGAGKFVGHFFSHSLYLKICPGGRLRPPLSLFKMQGLPFDALTTIGSFLTARDGAAMLTVDAAVGTIFCGEVVFYVSIRRRLEDSWLAKFAALYPGLRRLTLTSCSDLGDIGFSAMSRFTQLESLSLRDADLGDDRWRFLLGCSRLKVIDLAWCEVNDRALQGIGKTCPQLEYLRLLNTSVTATGVAALARLPRLEVIGLELCGITAPGLAALSTAPRLRVLDVNCCPEIDRAGFAAAVAGFPALRELYCTETHLQLDTELRQMFGVARPEVLLVDNVNRAHHGVWRLGGFH